jgi:peroxiredoxin/predicted 2-oxoglutarate/Fe(II)-dependent dioxygenase YbiX
MTLAKLPPIGDVPPMFTAKTDVNDEFYFGALGGQWIVLAFFGSMADPAAVQADQHVRSAPVRFDDKAASYFGVSNDPLDRVERGLRSASRGLRYFYDDDSDLARLYGVLTEAGLQPSVFLLDRTLRLVEIAPLAQMDAVLARLAAYLAEEDMTDATAMAPVLTLPRIFEPELCRRLIDYYAAGPPKDSGVTREVDGRTEIVLDSKVKRRTDRLIEDPELIAWTRNRLHTRLRPAIERAFRWTATRVERYLVSCYDSADGGFFNPHRDNIGPMTDHRMFAVSLNLNDDYEGGELKFPEFGPRLYKPPAGGATVFSCGLLHAATPVTAGVRYAFLPFLYDEERARLRIAALKAQATAALD